MIELGMARASIGCSARGRLDRSLWYSLASAMGVIQPRPHNMERHQMVSRAVAAICAAVLSVGVSCNALAQDAAETAIILSGSGHSQGGAARSLGSAISGSMDRAAATIEASRGGPYPANRRGAGTAHAPYVILGKGDPLAGTGEPTYRLSNGASIRVSGRLVQAPGTACVKDCAEKQAP
jgi:hypothetical protein